MAERFMAELTRRGMGRQTAYALAKDCSMEAYERNTGLLDIVLTKDEIKQYLSEDEIKKIMDPHTYIGSSVEIVDNVLDVSKEWF